METKELAHGSASGLMGIPYNMSLVKLLHNFHAEGIDEAKKLARHIRDEERFLGFGGTDGKTIKEFLTTEALEGTDLVVEEVAGTINDAAQASSKLKGIFPMQRISSNSFRWPLGQEALGPLGEVAEGAEIDETKEAPTKRDFTIRKYAGKARITSELIDDSLFNMVERELRNLGMRAGLTWADLMVDRLLENAGKEHDTAGSNQDGAALQAAIALLRGEPTYLATHCILHPEFMTKLIADSDITHAQTLNQANQVVDPITGQTVNKLFGVQLVEFDHPTTTTNFTWGFASGGEIGGIVVNSAQAGAYAVARDLRLEDYKDPVHDLVGVKATIRMDAQHLHANAIARIEF